MKLKTIRTNIKSPGGEDVTTEIGDKTLLIGPNECGKSAIAEAIQLALTGGASGLFMRSKPVRSGSQLSALCPERGETVFSEAIFTDGAVARWELRTGGKAKRTGPEGCVTPVSELRVALSGSIVSAYKFFFQRLIDSVSLGELQKNFPVSRPVAMENLLSILPADGNQEKITPEQVIYMLETAAKKKRDLRSAAKSGEAVLMSLQGAEKIPNSKLYDEWKSLFTAINFEKFKRVYRDNPGLREFITQEVDKIGTPEELKAMEGSAQISERIETILYSNALFKVALDTRRGIEQNRIESEQMENLEKCIEYAIQKILIQPLKSYCSRVNEYLPGEDEFCFFEAKHGSFHPALIRKNGIHIALSGSTESRVLGAMAAALSRPGIPSMIILDDRMWDADTLAKTLTALGKCPGQILIMTTIRPRGKKRAGWTYINLDSTPIPVELTPEEKKSLESWGNSDDVSDLFV